MGVDDMQTRSWMSDIADERDVSLINIPGTHDSCTYRASQREGLGFVKTQNMSLDEQLENGCRFLDIRVRRYNNKFVIHHGKYYLHLNFDDVVKACTSFLNKNPSECIMMSIKEECSSHNSSKSVQEVFEDYYYRSPSTWFVENYIPKLKDVRGKILLLRRFKITEGSLPLGIDFKFEDNTSFKYTFNKPLKHELVCEDYYTPWSVNLKKKAIINNLSLSNHSSNEKILFVTFLSGTNFIKMITPLKLAREINHWFLHKYGETKSRMGVVMYDFAAPKYLQNIIRKNFNNK